MRKVAVAAAWSIFAIISVTLIVLFIPFIGFGGKSYTAVCADAARMYGLDISDYKITFQSTVKDVHGESVEGLFQIQNTKQSIIIDENWSRPMVIATIFHEFAHAAQYRYKLDMGKYTIEQHAEILSFYMMWNSSYHWDAVHMITEHLLGKPPEYRATGDLLKIFFTDKIQASHTFDLDISHANS